MAGSKRGSSIAASSEVHALDRSCDASRRNSSLDSSSGSALSADSILAIQTPETAATSQATDIQSDSTIMQLDSAEGLLMAMEDSTSTDQMTVSNLEDWRLSTLAQTNPQNFEEFLYLPVDASLCGLGLSNVGDFNDFSLQLETPQDVRYLG